MIALVEGASRQKTPNEIALHILLVGLTIDLPVRLRHAGAARALLGVQLSATVIVALLVCLIPTTIGGLLSAIGIAGMDRLLRKNVHRHERPRGRGGRRRRHAAARQDRHHHPRQPHGDRAHPRCRACGSRSWPTPRSWPAWPTRRPRAARSSSLAKERYGLRGREVRRAGRDLRPLHRADPHERAATSPAGVIRKGAVDAVARHVESLGGAVPRGGRGRSPRGSATRGGTPLAVADGARVLGHHPPQGRGQGRASRSASRASAPWASAR